MPTPLGVQLEETNALKDAADYLYERGIDIKLFTNTEATISRDKFQSIKKRTPVSYSLHAYPVTFSPSDDEIKKAGIKERVDVLITLATKHLTDIGITYQIIDHIRYEVELENNLYTIKDKNQINHFSHVYLNVVLGLTLK